MEHFAVDARNDADTPSPRRMVSSAIFQGLCSSRILFPLQGQGQGASRASSPPGFHASEDRRARVRFRRWRIGLRLPGSAAGIAAVSAGIVSWSNAVSRTYVCATDIDFRRLISLSLISLLVRTRRVVMRMPSIQYRRGGLQQR